MRKFQALYDRLPIEPKLLATAEDVLSDLQDAVAGIAPPTAPEDGAPDESPVDVGADEGSLATEGDPVAAAGVWFSDLNSALDALLGPAEAARPAEMPNITVRGMTIDFHIDPPEIIFGAPEV